VAGVALSTLGPEREASLPSGTIPSAVEEDDRPSIAVLPFENFSPNRDDADFADGMHEQLITTLSEISALLVRGRTSVMMFRENPRPLPETTTELGLEYWPRIS